MSTFQRLLQKEWRDVVELQSGRQLFNPANILRALMALQVRSGIDLELEINRILARATRADRAFLILSPELDPESMHLIIRVAGERVMDIPRALVPISVHQSFYTALVDPKVAYLDHLDSTQTSIFAQILAIPTIHSLMCIPIHYPYNSGKVALFACLVNKSSSTLPEHDLEEGDHSWVQRRKPCSPELYVDFDSQDGECVKEIFFFISSLVIPKLPEVDLMEQYQNCLTILDIPPQLLVETVHPELILKAVVQQAWNLIDCERCGLLLVGDTFLEGMIYERLDDNEFSQRVTIPRNQGILGQVIGTGLVFNIRCSSPEPTLAMDLTHISGARSILCVPVLFKGRVLAALDFCNKNGASNFSLEDERVAHVAATYCAAAIRFGDIHALIGGGRSKFTIIRR